MRLLEHYAGGAHGTDGASPGLGRPLSPLTLEEEIWSDMECSVVIAAAHTRCWGTAPCRQTYRHKHPASFPTHKTNLGHKRTRWSCLGTQRTFRLSLQSHLVPPLVNLLFSVDYLVREIVSAPGPQQEPLSHPPVGGSDLSPELRGIEKLDTRDSSVGHSARVLTPK